MFIEALSSDMSIQVAYETSNDLETWSAGGTIGDPETTDGWSDATGSSLNTALYYRFGVQVKNASSATNAESALVSLTITPSTF